MTPEERERMHALCERIAKEQNHEKFVKLVQELNDMLEHKEQRLEDPSKQS
jgi:altronate dehydratase